MTIRRRVNAFLAAGMVISAIGVVSYSMGYWIPNQPPRQDYPVRGIDVSWHQGVIDWGAIPHEEVQFVYLKATEGGDFQDELFLLNWKRSAEAGLRRGAYHFFTLKTPGLDQAANFKAVVPDDPLALPPAIDLEFVGNSSARPDPGDFQRELEAFIREVRLFYGREPVLYTAGDFKNHYLRNFPIRRLWLRSVIASPGKNEKPWDFWQYSGKGRTRGIEGFVDQNVFNGDLEKFESFAGERLVR